MLRDEVDENPIDFVPPKSGPTNEDLTYTLNN